MGRVVVVTGLGESADQTLKLLARALAPYLREEFRHLEELDSEALDPSYDLQTCRRFVTALGDHVLRRARTLFEILASDGLVDSVRLAALLDVAPRELSGNLTTPLKRRAKALRLRLPFAGGLGTEPYGGILAPSPDMDPDRTHWQDRDGIARRMLNAIEDETSARAKHAGRALR
jgi:hypothetical protein